MRIKYLLFFLSVIALSLGIALLIKDDPSLTVITSPKVYSFKQTSPLETFTIPILVSDPDAYQFDEEFIKEMTLVNANNIIPLSLNEIYVSEDYMLMNDIKYYQVDFVVKIGFESDDYEIAIADCTLVISYQNSEVVELFIGEFNYIFLNDNNDDFYLTNLIGTYSEIDGKKTVSGIDIELVNHMDENVIITKFDVLSSSIGFNNDYTTSLIENVDIFDPVEDIIHEPYSPTSSSFEPRETLVYRNGSVKLYIPLTFGEYDFVHRFCIRVIYEKDNQVQEYILDDFIFMTTSIFAEEYKDNFRYYEYEN